MKIKDKVTHVKKAKQSRNHKCHWPGCKMQVPPALWGCREHWYRLSTGLRRKIWATYVPGQEITQSPSEAYVQVARKVQTWIEENHPEEQ